MIDQRLHVLRMLAEHGTVTATARALNYTPSAVSHQLRTLARDLGVSCSSPEGARVRLTPAARTLLAHADDLFAQWEEIRAEVARSADERTGSLRIVRLLHRRRRAAAVVARRVAEAHPRVDGPDHRGRPRGLLRPAAGRPGRPRRGRRHRVPAARAPTRASTSSRCWTTRWTCWSRREPPARRPVLGVCSARPPTSPGSCDRPGRPHHQLVLAACAAAGFTPGRAHEAAEWDTGAALVAAGFGRRPGPPPRPAARPATRSCGSRCAATRDRPGTSSPACAGAAASIRCSPRRCVFWTELRVRQVPRPADGTLDRPNSRTYLHVV